MAQLDEQKLHKECLARCLAVGQVGIVTQAHRRIKEFGLHPGSLPRHQLLHRIVGVEQRKGRRLACHHEVTQVLGKPVDKEMRIKSMLAHLLVNQQRLRHIAGTESVEQARIIALVEHVEVVDGRLVGDLPA